MPRPHVLIFALLLTLGCSRAPQPVPLTPGIRVDTVAVATPVAALDTTQPAMRAAIQVANQAAGAVDTILVHPDTLVVHVGEATQLTALTIEPRDSSGGQVLQFAPMIDIEDKTVAEYGASGVVGLRPGRTRLIITPFSLDPSVHTKTVQAVVAIRVIP
jgi:hypothetical protein